MNEYQWFYKRKSGWIKAETSYKAQLAAALLVNAKKAYEVTIVLVQRADGSVVKHSTSEL